MSGILAQSRISFGLNPVILVAHSCPPSLASEEELMMKTTKLWMVQIWPILVVMFNYFKKSLLLVS